MATLGDIGAFWASDRGSQYNRWLGGCLKTAYNVQNEDPVTANHADRLVWANVVLAGTEAELQAKVVQQMRYAIASNATLQGDPNGIDDAGILFIIASQLDALT